MNGLVRFVAANVAQNSPAPSSEYMRIKSFDVCGETKTYPVTFEINPNTGNYEFLSNINVDMTSWYITGDVFYLCLHGEGADYNITDMASHISVIIENKTVFGAEFKESTNVYVEGNTLCVDIGYFSSFEPPVYAGDASGAWLSIALYYDNYLIGYIEGNFEEYL